MTESGWKAFETMVRENKATGKTHFEPNVVNLNDDDYAELALGGVVDTKNNIIGTIIFDPEAAKRFLSD